MRRGLLVVLPSAEKRSGETLFPEAGDRNEWDKQKNKYKKANTDCVA